MYNIVWILYRILQTRINRAILVRTCSDKNWISYNRSPSERKKCVYCEILGQLQPLVEEDWRQQFHLQMVATYSVVCGEAPSLFRVNFWRAQEDLWSIINDSFFWSKNLKNRVLSCAKTDQHSTRQVWWQYVKVCFWHRRIHFWPYFGL